MFTPSFVKPGKGVPKDDHNKPIMTRFFEVLSRKLWNIIKLNLLYIIFALPFFVVTMFLSGFMSAFMVNAISPSMQSLYTAQELSTALASFDLITRLCISFIFMILFGFAPICCGFTYIIRNYTKEIPVFLISDISDHIKSNLKQSIALWIIDILVFTVFFISVTYYMEAGGTSFIIGWFIVLAMIVYAIMHFYIYQIMITFKLPLRHILKNAVIFTMSAFPKNLLLFFIYVLVHIACPLAIVFAFNSVPLLLLFIIFEILLLPMLTQFIYTFFTSSAIDRCIKIAKELFVSDSTK